MKYIDADTYLSRIKLYAFSFNKVRQRASLDNTDRFWDLFCFISHSGELRPLPLNIPAYSARIHGFLLLVRYPNNTINHNPRYTDIRAHLSSPLSLLIQSMRKQTENISGREHCSWISKKWQTLWLSLYFIWKIKLIVSCNCLANDGCWAFVSSFRIAGWRRNKL